MKTLFLAFHALVAATAACASPPAQAGFQAHWPTWRGPAGTGVASGMAPQAWSDESNVLWRVPIEGRGMSTPVAWGDRLYLTTAVSTGREDESTGQEEQEFVVLCVDRESGATIWRRVVQTAVPHEGFHKSYGSFASASPVIDAERLWVSFGSFGVYCLDHEGRLLWARDLGVRMEMRRQFGEGQTPTVHAGVLVQGCDNEAESFVVALDSASGDELWRVARDEPSVWAPPLVTEYGGQTQVVLSGVERVRSYDLASGELVWECGGLGTNPIPTPLRIGDQIIVMSGHRDPNILSIRLGGEGDLTDSDHVVWESAKGPSYTASPVLHDGRLYCVMDRGFISCFDATTGDAHFVEERLPRGSTLKASPVAANGVLYVPTEDGDVHLIALEEQYRHVATNTLTDATFIASPIIVEDDLILRSLTHLYCVREPQGAGDASEGADPSR